MNYKLVTNCITGAVFLLFSLGASAQIDTIGKGKSRLLTTKVKPGLRQYIIYMQDPAKSKTITFWFWSRNIRREVRGGENVITNTQTWIGGDTIAYRSMYSVNRANDFSPLFHSETAGKKTKAYNWSEKNISGADTVARNAAKGFNLDFKALTYNWNLDMETFEQLPLAAGKTFAINFYDAGLDPPEYFLYKVSGSEVLKSYENKTLDCWILSTEGSMPNGAKYTERFWLTKSENEFIKEEDTYPGGYRYKLKMPDVLPDILKTFNR